MRDAWNCKGDPYASVIDTADLRNLAFGLGAASFGATSADPFPDSLAALREHKLNGLSGPLHFTFDDPALATDVKQSFPWARSLIVLGHNYLADAPGPAPTGPLVARFAGENHYQPLRRSTEAIARHLEEAGHLAALLIDDNRLVDRAAAARAGLGWIGKSTMVIAPGHGPWMLFGSVVTDADLEPTLPMRRGCGTCTSCIPACPTGAITPQGLDARRCLATWLQTSGSIPVWIRPLLGRRIYGCDDCLTSCPPGLKLLHESPAGGTELTFDELLGMSDSQLVERFPWWFIPHRDGRYLRRNILVAAGNSGEPDVLDPIERHLTHRSSMIRSHAAWALARLGPEWAEARLQEALAAERAPETRRELAIALTMLEADEDYPALLALDELSRTVL